MKKRTITHLTMAKVLPFLLTALLAAPPAASASATLEDHRIQWSGSMPASTHTGLLSPRDFDIRMGENGTIAYLKVVLDMDTINVTDLKGGKRNKLMKHLRSEDFFYVEEYPTASFELNEHEDGMLHGSITIRGITKPISIPVNIFESGNKHWKLTGSFQFNRQDFNVNYQNSGLFGVAKDKLIRDLVDLEVELTVAEN